MIAFKPGKYVDDSAKLAKAVRRAGRIALRILGFQTRAQAQASIEPERGPSRPGQPPHTHTATRTKKGKPRGKGRLPKAILYAVETDPDRVVIGPSKNLIGTVGQAFEHEGEVQYKGRNYPPRPFMAPALALEAPKLPGFLIEQLDKIK